MDGTLIRLVAAVIALVSGVLLALFVFTPWLAYPDTDRDFEMRISGGGEHGAVPVGETIRLTGIRLFTNHQQYYSTDIGPRIARRFRWSVLSATDTTWSRYELRDLKRGRAMVDARGRLTGACEGGVLVEMREGKGRYVSLFTVTAGSRPANPGDCD